MPSNEIEENNDLQIDIDIVLDIDPVVDEPLWDKLIQQILAGNVIPVIGADMLIDNSVNLHDLLIQGVAKKINLKQTPDSFSDLIYSPQYRSSYNIDSIYYQINNYLAKNNKISPSRKLKRLLSIRQFPFVITTSFTPIVENAMRDVWGEKLRVLRFNNNPPENDDIKSEADTRIPTIYYMFGKAGEGAHKYVLTDIDMLNFVSSWLSNDNTSRPRILCNELKNKYLLMLGNNYNSWLFRFIWYSIRKPEYSQGMLAYDDENLDESLLHFLERAKTFTKQNINDVIDQIIIRLNKKNEEHERNKFNRPENNTDIFISYSRTDIDIVLKLYDSLTAKGKNVWFDKKNIEYGGAFMTEIRNAIHTTKYFIPVFTSSITKEKNDSHVYRNEWDMAIDMGISLGRTFIIPIVERGFDFYHSAIPVKMQQANAVFFDKEGTLDDVTDKIIDTINMNL